MLHAYIYNIEDHQRYDLSILECRRTDGTIEWIVFDPRYHESNSMHRLQVPFSSFSEAAGLYRSIAGRAVEAGIELMRPPDKKKGGSHG